MATLSGPRIWIRKPPRGAVLDPQHPLSRGLQAGYIFGEGAGAVAHDVRGRRPATLISPATWSLGPTGPRLRTVGADDVAQSAAETSLSVTHATMVWRGTLTATPPQFSGLMSMMGTSRAAMLASILVPPRRLNYIWDGTSDEYEWDSGLQLTTNVPLFAAIIITPTQAIAYLNGQTAINAVSHGASTWNGAYVINGDTTTTGRTVTGDTDMALFYNRALSLAELRTLERTPYAIFRAPRRVWAGGGAPTTATLRPDGDGTYDGDWTLTGGTAGLAYTTIDESSTDDADYISNNDTSAPYQAQSVTLGDMPDASVIVKLEMFWRSRCAFSTLSTVPFFRVGGADTELSAQTVTTTDAEYSRDITTLASWTDTLINSMEIGWRKNATANNTLRVTQAWVVVTYRPAPGPTTFERDVPATAVLLKSASRSVPTTAVLLKSLSRSVPATAVMGHTAILRPSDRNRQIGFSWVTELAAIDDIYTSVDEASTDDGDYITNNRTGTDDERTGFGLEMMPESAGHATIMQVVLHYRAKSASASGKIRPFFRQVHAFGATDIDPGSDVTLGTSVAEYTFDVTALRFGSLAWTLTDLNYATQIGFYKADTASNAVTVTQAWLEVIYATGPAPVRIIPVNAHIAWQIVPMDAFTNETFDTPGATVFEGTYAYAAFEVTVTDMAFNTVDPHLHIIVSRIDFEDVEFPVSEGEIDGVGTFVLGLPTVDIGLFPQVKLTCVVEGDVTFEVLSYQAGYLLADNGV